MAARKKSVSIISAVVREVPPPSLLVWPVASLSQKESLTVPGVRPERLRPTRPPSFKRRQQEGPVGPTGPAA